MIEKPAALQELRVLSARLGKDPLQVQGPGGNTSIKDGSTLWIKASGTELADAIKKDIFVVVDRAAALAEAKGEQGDGSCKDTLLDPEAKLRPSIETTFHAALEHAVVLHTHSVNTIVHAISPEGRKAAQEKLDGLPFAMVPYAKPGLPLTKQIMATANADTKVIILQNHGLICCGDTVDQAESLIAEVEQLLNMPPRTASAPAPKAAPPEGYQWSAASWIACDELACKRATSGTYYPDHVVFLGPALPDQNEAQASDDRRPAIVCKDAGIALISDATASQQAMLQCLSDVLGRLPEDWSAEPIGIEAEAVLLNWDAEKYRQALAKGA